MLDLNMIIANKPAAILTMKDIPRWNIWFIKLTAAMDQEQEENQRRLQELLRMLQQSDAQESEVRTFIREIRQYATIQELDETVLNRLISRILVGEVKKVDGQKVQKVRIVYNFVGDVWNDTKISSCNVPTQA